VAKAFTGLAPNLDASGLNGRQGGLTKHGDAVLRRALFSAGQADRIDPTLAAQHPLGCPRRRCWSATHGFDQPLRIRDCEFRLDQFQAGLPDLVLGVTRQRPITMLKLQSIRAGEFA